MILVHSGIIFAGKLSELKTIQMRRALWRWVAAAAVASSHSDWGKLISFIVCLFEVSHEKLQVIHTTLLELQRYH